MQRELKSKYSDGFILIRPYQKTDVDKLYTAARESINEVYRWLPWCHPLYSIKDSKNWVRSRQKVWDSGKEYSFVIEDVENGKFLGGAGINEINRVHRFGNLGYWIRTGETGRGVATAATRMTALFGFEQLKLERIEIIVATGNEASQHVAEKAGAKREGILRKRLLINETYHDAVVFSFIPDDIKKMNRDTTKS